MLDTAIRVEILRLPGPSLPPDHLRGQLLNDAIDRVTDTSNMPRSRVKKYHEKYREDAVRWLKSFGARLAARGGPKAS